MKKLTTLAAGALAGSLLVVGLSAGSASAEPDLSIPLQIGNGSGSIINSDFGLNVKALEGSIAQVTPRGAITLGSGLGGSLGFLGL